MCELPELCVKLRGCVECNKLLILNGLVLLSCTYLEMHHRDGKKIPLNLQDCLRSEFAAKYGSQMHWTRWIILFGDLVMLQTALLISFCWSKRGLECFYMYRSVPQIRPLFWNLTLSTKCRGGLYEGCDNFCRNYALPSDKAWPHCHCQWGVEAKCEASPSTWQRDGPNGSGRLTSFSIECQKSRALPQSSWCVHRWCGWSLFAVHTLMVDSRVA